MLLLESHFYNTGRSDGDSKVWSGQKTPSPHPGPTFPGSRLNPSRPQILISNNNTPSVIPPNYHVKVLHKSQVRIIVFIHENKTTTVFQHMVLKSWM